MTGAIRIVEVDQVATVWIDNPSKKNAVSRTMWIALADAFTRFAATDKFRCIVVRGSGGEAFASGADIEEFSSTRANRAQATDFGAHVHRALHAIRVCETPVVAAINGVCVGGGLELAAVCDLRIASQPSRFGIPVARLGATLAYAELEGLLELVGRGVALELLLEGRVFGATEALDKRLITRVVASSAFDEEIDATVGRICKGAPLSARRHKRFVNRLQRSEPLSETETAEGFDCFDTEDYRIGYRTFLEKTAPVFVGR